MKRILVADDDLEWLELVALHLRGEENEVYESSNGLDAYRLYCEKQPDIVVLDVDMPSADGISLAKQIHSVNPRTAILLMSALTDSKYVEAGYDNGAGNYFKKPFSIRELAACIRNMDVQATYSFGRCTFNSRTRNLTVDNKEEHTLSRMQAALLSMLCHNMGEPVMRKDMYTILLG